MHKGVVALESHNTVYKAAVIMEDAVVGSVIVLKNKKAVGIITERDIVRKVIANKQNPSRVELGAIMTSPLRVIPIEASIKEAAIAMHKYDIKKLPVMNSKRKIVGLITETDILSTYPSLIDLMVEEEIIKRYDPNLADLSHYHTDVNR